MEDEHTKKIIVKNLPSSTTWTCDHLQNFLECVTPFVVAHDGILLFKDFTDVALLTLEDAPSAADFQKANKSLAQMPFDERTLTLELVLEPTCKLLTHLTDPSFTYDLLRYYFDNPRYGCGDAEVKECWVYPEHDLAVVLFSSPEAVKGVVSKGPHQIKRGAEPVIVQAWYEDFHGPLLDRLQHHKKPEQHDVCEPRRQEARASGRHGTTTAYTKPVNQPFFPTSSPSAEASPQNVHLLGSTEPRMAMEMYQLFENERKEREKQKLEEELKRVKEKHTETMQQKEAEAELLKRENEKLKKLSERYVHVPAHKLSLLKEFAARWTRCKMTLLDQKEEILLYGSEVDLEDGKQQILLQMQSMHDDSIPLTKAAFRVLETNKGKRFLDEMVQRHRRCSVQLQGNTLLSASFELENLQAFRKEFENSMSHRIGKVPPSLFDLPEFRTLKNKLEDEYTILLEIADSDCEDIQLDGCTADVELAATKLEKFTSQHRSDRNTFQIPGAAQAKAVKELFGDRLEDAKQMITKNRGEVTEESWDDGYLLTFKCRQDFCDDVMKHLNVIKDKLFTVPVNIDRTFTDSCERALLINGLHDMGVEVFCLQVKQALHTRFLSEKCTVDIQLPPKSFLPQFRLKDRRHDRRRSDRRFHRGRRSTEARADTPFFEQWTPPSSPERRGSRARDEENQERDHDSGSHYSLSLCTVIRGSTTITVKSGDITEEKADAAVSVVGSDMNIKGTSIGSAFFKKCPSLAQELRSKGCGGTEDDDGHLIVTPVCECGLPMSTLFHAVLTKAPHDEAMQNVKYVVRAALQRAVQDGLTSVAFPPIGVGRRFHYKGSPVASAMVAAIEEFLYHNRNCLQAITIVVFDTSMADTFSEVLQQKLGKGKPALATAAAAAPKDSQRKSAESDRFKSKHTFAGRAYKDSPTGHFEALVCTTKKRNNEQIVKTVLNELKTTFLREEHISDVGAFEKLGSEKVDEISALAASKNVHISLNGKTIRLCGQKQNVVDMMLKIRDHMSEHVEQQEKKKWSKRQNLGIPVKTHRLPSYWKVCRNNPEIDFDEAIASWKKYGTHRYNRVSPEQREAVENLVLATWEAEKVSYGSDAKGLQAGYTLKIVKIERLENPELFQTYSTQREALFKTLQDMHGKQGTACFTPVENLKGSTGAVATTANIDDKGPLALDIYSQVNELYLFHGTKKDVLHKICRQGLDFRLAKKGMVGQGVYAAESSTKSDQYADSKHSRTSGEELTMILMRVLLGQPFMHTTGMAYKAYQRPPCMSCLQPQCKCEGSQLFDSVIFDSDKIFREFVLYDKNVCYPEYIITYTREDPPSH